MVPFKRILIIKLRHFGDVLLTTPVISSLKANYPDALIDVLVYQPTEAMLIANPDVDHCYTIDRNLKHQTIWRQLRGEWQLWRQLKQQRYDLVINLADQWRAGFYCLSLRAQLSLGLAFVNRQNWLWRFLHDQLSHTQDFHQQHTVQNNLRVLLPLKLPLLIDKVSLYYTGDDQTFITNQCQRLTDVIVIQPTARWAFKTWQVDAFIALVKGLMAKGQQIVLTAGPSATEKSMVNDIYQACQPSQQLINLAGQLTIGQLAALLARAKLFIGVDSMAMHMAASLQRPSVVLFGPSNRAQWHPWQTAYRLLWAGDYRPLPAVDEVDTDTDERYLAAIPVTDVLAAVDNYLSGEQ